MTTEVIRFVCVPMCGVMFLMFMPLLCSFLSLTFVGQIWCIQESLILEILLFK